MLPSPTTSLSILSLFSSSLFLLGGGGGGGGGGGETLLAIANSESYRLELLGNHFEGESSHDNGQGVHRDGHGCIWTEPECINDHTPTCSGSPIL